MASAALRTGRYGALEADFDQHRALSSHLPPTTTSDQAGLGPAQIRGSQAGWPLGGQDCQPPCFLSHPLPTSGQYPLVLYGVPVPAFFSAYRVQSRQARNYSKTSWVTVIPPSKLAFCMGNLSYSTTTEYYCCHNTHPLVVEGDAAQLSCRNLLSSAGKKNTPIVLRTYSGLDDLHERCGLGVPYVRLISEQRSVYGTYKGTEYMLFYCGAGADTKYLCLLQAEPAR